MTLFRLPDLIERLPDQAAELTKINDQIDAALRELTSRRYGRFTERRFRLALLGTRQCPYGLIRPLIGDDIPPEFDAICVAAAEGVLGLGD